MSEPMSLDELKKKKPYFIVCYCVGLLFLAGGLIGLTESPALTIVVIASIALFLTFVVHMSDIADAHKRHF